MARPGYDVTVIETKMVQAVKVFGKVTAENLEFQAILGPCTWPFSGQDIILFQVTHISVFELLIFSKLLPLPPTPSPTNHIQ
jgi:hypothetical protein